MKKIMKMVVVLSFVIFLVACKEDNKISDKEDNKISFEEILPAYYKTEKMAGYRVDNSTKYLRKNIFSIKNRKQNRYKFNYASFNVKGKAILDQFPHAFCVDKDGSIYINNWTKQNSEGKLFGAQIVKINSRGKLLKKVKYIGKVRGIYSFMDGYLFINEYDYYNILNSNSLKIIGNGSIHNGRDGAVSGSYFLRLKKGSKKITYGGTPLLIVDLVSGEKIMSNKYSQYVSLAATYNFFYDVRGPSVFISKTTIEGFSKYTVGHDQFANKYFANAYYNQNSKRIDSLGELDEEKSHTPVDYILVQSKKNKKLWKLKFPYLYGKPDINAWGARTYHVTPSGIIYILNVHPKHGIHLDKYVPEPVAKKAGGADKAYY